MDIKIQKSAPGFLLLIFFLLSFGAATAQKYNFQHYGLENGISQSQVLGICQDKAKQIWFATLGGLNCFDGKQFISYDVADGLLSSSGYSIMCDNKGYLWMGSLKGISAFTDKGISNYAFKKDTSVRAFGRILSDKNNVLWAVSGQKLYKLYHNQLILETITAKNEKVSDIELDEHQNVCASISYKGIYKNNGTSWDLMIPITDRAGMSYQFDKQSADGIIFISNNKLFKANARGVEEMKTSAGDFNVSEFTTVLRDSENGIWIGTNKGLMLVKNNNTTFFGESNGFTNERVFSIFEDADHNIWIGTDGAGLYKYTNDGFLTFDKSQGLKNDLIMSFAKNTRGDIFLGTNGGGLLSYIDKKFKQENLPAPNSSTFRINCLRNDKNDNLWIGTDNMGFWKRYMAGGKIIYKQIARATIPINHIIQDDLDNIWIATGNGCFYFDQHGLNKVLSFNQYCSSLLNIGGDSILVGSLNGVYLIKDKKLDTTFKPKGLGNKYTLCLNKYKSFVLIGSNDRGLFIWNIKTNVIQNVTTKDGLYSDAIYSIDIVGDQLWLGTGRGVNKFKMKIKNNRLNLEKAYLLHVVAESNENAIMHTDSTVWVGANGANIYSINAGGMLVAVPNTVIQSVGLFSGSQSKRINYIYKSGYKLPVALSLPSDESHLSIKFSAVQFTDEKDNKFQYQLDGLDKSYSKPILSDFVDYPSLPPGNYTFRVRAINAAGQFKEPAVFSFVIIPTFTETIKFKLLLVILLLSATYGFYAYKRYKDKQELEYISALKIKEQEFVRRQTSEDFHDDLGNKLTRINMLSELLDKKMDPDKTEEKFLVKQIRSSAAEMYSGTKNILWALNPDNDNLWEVYLSIEKFGIELFSNINIGFHMSGDLEEIKKIRLPLGFSRNIILISKELLHNILRHSEADSVTLSVEITSDRYIRFSLTDDGKGFETDKISEGAGIRNMQNRAKKLNGTLIYHSQPGKGTTSTLTIPIP